MFNDEQMEVMPAFGSRISDPEYPYHVISVTAAQTKWL